jgi:hypothetical protein
VATYPSKPCSREDRQPERDGLPRLRLETGRGAHRDADEIDAAVEILDFVDSSDQSNKTLVGGAQPPAHPAGDTDHDPRKEPLEYRDCRRQKVPKVGQVEVVVGADDADSQIPFWIGGRDRHRAHRVEVREAENGARGKPGELVALLILDRPDQIGTVESLCLLFVGGVKVLGRDSQAFEQRPTPGEPVVRIQDFDDGARRGIEGFAQSTVIDDEHVKRRNPEQPAQKRADGLVPPIVDRVVGRLRHRVQRARYRNGIIGVPSARHRRGGGRHLPAPFGLARVVNKSYARTLRRESRADAEDPLPIPLILWMRRGRRQYQNIGPAPCRRGRPPGSVGS